MNHRYLPLVLGLILLASTGCGLSGFTSGTLTQRQDFVEGLAYEALSEYNRAESSYMRVMESPLAHRKSRWTRKSALRLARLYANNLDRPDSAVFYYRSLVDEYSPQPEIMFELAEYLERCGRFEKSIEMHEDFYRKYKDSPLSQEVLYSKAGVYSGLGRLEEAVATYKKLIEDYPGGNLLDGAYFYLARVLGDMDREDDQIHYYRLLLENHPESDLREIVMYNLFRLALSRERNSEALRYAEKYKSEFANGSYIDEIDNFLAEEGEE